MYNKIDIYLEEYKIIQSKIDKIGEFKFKIRGWAITITSAVLITLLTKNFTFISMVMMIISQLFIIYIFSRIEYKQDEFSKIIGDRAIILEKVIYFETLTAYELKKKKLLPLRDKSLKKLISSPRIGVELKNNISEKKIIDFKNLFYSSQYALLILLLLFLFITNIFNMKITNEETIKNKNEINVIVNKVIKVKKHGEK